MAEAGAVTKLAVQETVHVVPRAHVLRLLLQKDDLGERSIAVEDLGELGRGPGMELLYTDDGDGRRCSPGLVAPGDGVVGNLARAEDDSFHRAPVDLAGEVRRLLGSILERLSRIRGAGLGSLTARELLCAVQLEDRAAASELTQVLLTAERMRYAGVPASRGELVAAVDGARRLLERLEAR